MLCGFFVQVLGIGWYSRNVWFTLLVVFFCYLVELLLCIALDLSCLCVWFSGGLIMFLKLVTWDFKALQYFSQRVTFTPWSASHLINLERV